jgi:hypothetical protein
MAALHISSLKRVTKATNTTTLLCPAVAAAANAVSAACRWGYLSRAGLNDKSQLCRQIEKYADVYSSRVSNFLRYSPYMYFRSPTQSLAHDRNLSALYRQQQMQQQQQKQAAGGPLLESSEWEGPDEPAAAAAAAPSNSRPAAAGRHRTMQSQQQQQQQDAPRARQRPQQQSQRPTTSGSSSSSGSSRR